MYSSNSIAENFMFFPDEVLSEKPNLF
jgi:hypothetical protein